MLKRRHPYSAFLALILLLTLGTPMASARDLPLGGRTPGDVPSAALPASYLAAAHASLGGRLSGDGLADAIPQPHFGFSSVLEQLATNVATPNAGLQFITNITIPNWTNTGAAGQPSFDIFNFDPVTRIMYLADRNNRGVDAFNTQTNTLLGTIPV